MFLFFWRLCFKFNSVSNANQKDTISLLPVWELSENAPLHCTNYQIGSNVGQFRARKCYRSINLLAIVKTFKMFFLFLDNFRVIWFYEKLKTFQIFILPCNFMTTTPKFITLLNSFFCYAWKQMTAIIIFCTWMAATVAPFRNSKWTKIALVILLCTQLHRYKCFGYYKPYVYLVRVYEIFTLCAHGESNINRDDGI